MMIPDTKSKLIAWVAVPLLFAVAAKAAYMFALSNMASGFFPHVWLWIIFIVVGIALGITARALSDRRPSIVGFVVYVFVMSVALVLIQAAISCSSGDCI
jgi:hypothetical protein